jgi:hypothetical protein
LGGDWRTHRYPPGLVVSLVSRRRLNGLPADIFLSEAVPAGEKSPCARIQFFNMQNKELEHDPEKNLFQSLILDAPQSVGVAAVIIRR